MKSNIIILSLAAIANRSTAQDYDNYQDYSQDNDNLYSDYATNRQGGGGFGIAQMAMASTASYFLGAKIHSSRATKKLKKKHQQDQKTLYTQYYNDVYKLEEEKAALQMNNDQLQLCGLPLEMACIWHVLYGVVQILSAPMRVASTRVPLGRTPFDPI